MYVVNDRKRTGSERRKKHRFRDHWRTDGNRGLESKTSENTRGQLNQIQLLSLKNKHSLSRWIHGAQIAASKPSEEARQTALQLPAADHKKASKSKSERQQKQDARRGMKDLGGK